MMEYCALTLTVFNPFFIQIKGSLNLAPKIDKNGHAIVREWNKCNDQIKEITKETYIVTIYFPKLLSGHQS